MALRRAFRKAAGKSLSKQRISLRTNRALNSTSGTCLRSLQSTMDGFFSTSKISGASSTSVSGKALRRSFHVVHFGGGNGEHEHLLGERFGIDDDEVVRLGRGEMPFREIIDAPFAQGEPECWINPRSGQSS